MNRQIAEFLLPINDENKCGKTPREVNEFSNIYYQLKTYRQNARLAERQRMQSGETELLIAAEWKEVEELAIKILIEESKDLEVASWLVEAWVRIYGFEGLLIGLKLLLGLIDCFNSDLSLNLPEELEIQLNAVQGLSGESQPGTLIMPLMSLPITQVINETNYATWQLHQAVESTEIKNEDYQKNQQETSEINQIKNAAANSANIFKESIIDILQQALSLLADCDAKFNTTFTEINFSWSFLRQSIESVIKAAKLLYQHKETPNNAESTQEKHSQSKEHNYSSGQQDRQIMLMNVSTAAKYFLEHEPHSPVAYLLQQAVRWSSLSLPELMQEICSGADNYFHYCRVTGLPLPNDDS